MKLLNLMKKTFKLKEMPLNNFDFFIRVPLRSYSVFTAHNLASRSRYLQGISGWNLVSVFLGVPLR